MAPIVAITGELYNTLTPKTEIPVFAVLSFAIATMGPQKFLDVLPLNLETPEGTKGEKPNRGWLIPLLNKSIFVYLPLFTLLSTWGSMTKKILRMLNWDFS